MTITETIHTENAAGDDLILTVRFMDGEEAWITEAYDFTNGVDLDPNSPDVKATFEYWASEMSAMYQD